MLITLLLLSLLQNTVQTSNIEYYAQVCTIEKVS